jgi:hypothetical protein
VATTEQKDKVKKLAKQGFKPSVIESKMKKNDKTFDWDNLRIGQYLYEQGLNGKSEKILKLTEKIQEKEIEKIAEEKAKIDYSIQDCFAEFEQCRKLALTPNADTGRIDIANALKAIENKAKLKGHYQADNEQKQSEFTNVLPFGFPENS